LGVVRKCLNKLQLASIYPLFRFSVNQRSFPLVEEPHLSAGALNLGEDFSIYGAISVGTSWTVENLLVWKPDVLVIHEGLLDLAHGNWHVVLQPIIEIPRIVRSSGKGSASRHNLDHLPFLESTVLIGATHQQLNKVSFGASLLGIRGRRTFPTSIDPVK
jgi:hypothetical protein